MNTQWTMAVAAIAGIALILVAAILIMEDARDGEGDGNGEDENGGGGGDDGRDEETEEEDDNTTIEISRADATWIYDMR